MAKNYRFIFFLPSLCSKKFQCHKEFFVLLDWNLTEKCNVHLLPNTFWSSFHRTHVFSACLHWCRRASDPKSWAELLWDRIIVLINTSTCIPMATYNQKQWESMQMQKCKMFVWIVSSLKRLGMRSTPQALQVDTKNEICIEISKDGADQPRLLSQPSLFGNYVPRSHHEGAACTMKWHFIYFTFWEHGFMYSVGHTPQWSVLNITRLEAELQEKK